MQTIENVIAQTSVPRVGLERHLNCDADTQARSLRGWNQCYDQLSAGRFVGMTLDVHLDGAQLFREHTSHALRQKGCAPEGAYLFAINVEPSVQSRFLGSLVTQDSLLLAADGTDFEFCSPAHYVGCGVTIKEEAVKSYAAVIGADLPDTHATGHDVIHAGAAVARLRSVLLSAFNGLERDQRVLENENARRSLYEDLLGLVFDALQGAESERRDQPTSHRHARIVGLAEEYVLSRPFESVSVADLCRHVGASRRLLQYAFQNVMDMPPNRYLRAIRLCRVRRELKAVGGSVNVQDAAARWGFWHLGHFALYYKQMFGERPSDTVRRATER